MKHLEQRRLDQHITILGWLHIANSVLLVIIGGFVFFFLSVIGPLSGDSDAAIILPIVAAGICGLLVIIALPGLAAGVGLLKRRSWGRIMGIIVAVFNLMNFPLGMALAAYSFWVLLQESSVDYFVNTDNEKWGIEN